MASIAVGPLCADVDDADLPLVSQHKWYATKPRHNWYAITHIDGKTVYMHRLILGAKQGELIDHRDGDGLNNSRANLRLCTPVENGRNRTRLSSQNTSGYTGVSFNKKLSRYETYAMNNRRMTKLGYYVTLEEAAEARDNYVRRNWGDFAPQQGEPLS